jgi:hypothetical protein
MIILEFWNLKKYKKNIKRLYMSNFVIKSKEIIEAPTSPKLVEVPAQPPRPLGVPIQVKIRTQVINEQTWEFCDIFINGKLADTKKRVCP